MDYDVDQYNAEFRRRVQDVTPEAMARLKTYAWPGNVRELRNTVERAMLIADANELSTEHFALGRELAGARLGEGMSLPDTGVDLEQLDRSLVVQALERSGWNQTQAATAAVAGGVEGTNHEDSPS